MADGMFSGRSVLGAQQLQRPVEPYLRQQYPEVYGALGGFMGMAPDEMSGSILDPNTARVRAGAQYGFPVGTALQVAPLAPMLAPAVKAGARALGPTAVRMGERYLQRQGLMPGVVEGGAIPGRDVITPQSKKELKSLADSFAEQIRALGFDAKVEHSGSKAGASSYINVSDPQTGRFLTKPIRISDHSKGPFESQNVINILNLEDDFPKVFEELNKMRAMGESLVFKQQKYAQSLIDDGVKPKVAYQQAKNEVKEAPTSTLYPAEERMAIAQQNAALPDWNKSSILMNPKNLIPLNKIEDAEKYKNILNSMQESGYQGRPILAYMDENKAKALTGSHRLYAARKAGIEVPVVFVKPSVMKWEDNNGLFGTFKESINDQRVYEHLKAAGDETAASLAKLENLLEPNEMPDAVRQYMADPRYSDPFADTTR